jgi:acyl-CoA thioester hydrolase
MENFRFVHEQRVEFRDLDGLGHVNNAVYLNYLESAKIGYFREVVGVTELSDLGIVADVKIAFRSPAFLGETIAIGTRVARVGTKSIDWEFELRGPDERMIAEASSVHVAFDYGPRQPTAVPDEWRRKIEAFEAKTPAPA